MHSGLWYQSCITEIVKLDATRYVRQAEPSAKPARGVARSVALVAIRREIATTQAELLRNYVQLALSPASRIERCGAVRIELVPWGLAEWGLAQGRES